MIVVIGVLILGIILSCVRRFVGWESEIFIDVGQIIVYLTFAMLVIVIIVNHSTANSYITQYDELKRTIEEARSNELSEYERGTLTEKIIEINSDIASNKYWNDTIFDIFVPDALAELEPLK